MSMEREGGMILTGKKPKNSEKSLSISLYPPEIPHRLTRA
jgi:hypothetical protein